MGMQMMLRRVAADQIDLLLAEPRRIHHCLFGEVQSETPEPKRLGLLDRLFGRKPEPRRSEFSQNHDWTPPPPGYEIDIDKSWHGIHFLLAGDADGGELPAATLLVGGTEIGDEDVGYGPARALSPAETADFALFLMSISQQDFQKRCLDLRELDRQRIYPEIWESADAQEYLYEYFSEVKRLVRDAAEGGDGLLIWIS